MSLTIGIRYLCGRAMATHPADRQRAEWPVHPDRAFMGLAAAHFETGADAGERAALEWLRPPRRSKRGFRRCRRTGPASRASFPLPFPKRMRCT